MLLYVQFPCPVTESNRDNIANGDSHLAVPNGGLARQETSFIDTITRMIPQNEDESLKQRIHEALTDLTQEYGGKLRYIH